MPLFQAATLAIEVQAGGIALLTFDVPQRTYNVVNRQFLADLDAACDRVAASPPLRLLAIRSGKATGFAAGADLQEFTTIRSPADAMAISAGGQRVFDKLAALRLPTVAIIDGVCLGGGLELALACDCRLVVDRPATQLGFPEIELGLIPGWGGTQRLPRAVGLERSMQVLLQRRRLNAREAERWGLARAVFGSSDEALKYLEDHVAEFGPRSDKAPQGLPLRTWRQRLLESTALGRWFMFRVAERLLRRRVPDDMPAPREGLQAIKVGLTRGMAAGLAYEREANGRMALSVACRNLVTLFFLIENARKAGEGPPTIAAKSREDTPPTTAAVRRIGVVGAGTMGAGIAQLASIKGFEVVVQEVSEEFLAAGVRRIEGLFQKAVERRLLSDEEARQKLNAIGKTTSWEGFAQVDIVVEAVVEDLAKKRDVFRELDRCTRPDTVLATNTSSLLVRQMQDGSQHPERVAGLHFFNPVHKMPLVEVVHAAGTSAAVVARLAQWSADLGKTPVAVKDSPGFVVNRILMPYLNEAGLLVAEGLSIEQVDKVMRRFGMPVGPLELLDQVGLDVAAHIVRAVGPVFGTRLVPHPSLERMAARGWLGQKSGKGFYVYEGKKRRVHAEALAELRPQAMAPPQLLRDARDRMVLPMVNEAAACLAEGLAERADVIDLAMVLGTGWAPHRGGPLRYADDRGAGAVVQSLEELVRRAGARFEPCAELRRRAATRELFYSPDIFPNPTA
jgi:3-hydroxyacyl-CoA dehydrogenase/enoyl-CoA hydratase/3-hydroxybutyryl-CoA epimerase